MNDTVPFYLQREAEVVDSAGVALSEWYYQVVPTDDSGIRFAMDSMSVATRDVAEGVLMPLSDSIYSLFPLLFVVALMMLVGVGLSGGGWILTTMKRMLTPWRERRSAFKQEVTVAGVWAVVLLLFQSFIVKSVAVYRGLDLFGGDLLAGVNPLVVFGLVFIALLLFVLIKGGIYRVTHLVFPGWGFQAWVNKFYILMGLSGVIMFLPVLFFVFTPEWSKWALWVVGASIVLSSYIVFINLLRLFVKNKIGLLNYFLYLCAFEIMPLVLLYKAVTINL